MIEGNLPVQRSNTGIYIIMGIVALVVIVAIISLIFLYSSLKEDSINNGEDSGEIIEDASENLKQDKSIENIEETNNEDNIEETNNEDNIEETNIEDNIEETNIEDSIEETNNTINYLKFNELFLIYQDYTVVRNHCLPQITDENCSINHTTIILKGNDERYKNLHLEQSTYRIGIHSYNGDDSEEYSDIAHQDTIQRFNVNGIERYKFEEKSYNLYEFYQTSQFLNSQGEIGSAIEYVFWKSNNSLISINHKESDITESYLNEDISKEYFESILTILFEDYPSN